MGTNYFVSDVCKKGHKNKLDMCVDQAHNCKAQNWVLMSFGDR